MLKHISIDNFKSQDPAMILDAICANQEEVEINIQHLRGGIVFYVNVNGVTVVRMRANKDRFNVTGDSELF